MNDDDLIRRGDALALMDKFGMDVVGLRHTLAALPAALAAWEARNG